jgi:hypothetical protein
MCSVSLSIINLRTNKEFANTMQQVWINKNPDFQREYEAWDDTLKTRFIETILIGRAMNPIWTIHNPDENSEEVLDGMHRLTTALDYLNNKFKLNSKNFTDQTLGSNYDKKIFKELSPNDQQSIRNYNFIFNQLDSTYRTDINKRRIQYEILNRSSRTLNDYEFNKVLYGRFFDIISMHKNDLKIFFKADDKRGELQTEIIDALVLSNEMPNSWASVASLRDKFYEFNLGDTELSVVEYLSKNQEIINDKLRMMKKIITTLKDNKFFSEEKKIFNKYYLPYKFVISRLLFKFNTNISLFNRHFIDIIERLKTGVTSVDIQEKLECGTRNAVFQKKLIKLIDEIINSSYEMTNDKRLFTQAQIKLKLEQQNNVCAICNLSKENYQGDHIIPWSKGGKTVFENLQVLCISCHQKKSADEI